MKRTLHSFRKITFLLIIAIGLFSANSFAQIVLNFPITSPAQNVTACNGSSLLTARVSVLIDSATGVDITVDLASGMEYVPGSVLKVSGTSGLTISENGGTPSSPVFTISGPLSVSNNLTFTIARLGTPLARTEALAGAIFKDNVKATIGSTTVEKNSAPYQVLYASLSMIQAEAKIGAELNETYTRTFSITNGSLGCAKDVYFTIEYPDVGPSNIQGIEQVSLTLEGNPVVGGTFDADTNTYSYSFSGALLGADNQFCNGETLNFTEVYTVKVCDADTNYSTGWGCVPVEPTEWVQTATSSGNVAMVIGVPNTDTHVNTNLDFVDMCSTWTMRTTFNSSGTGNITAATLYDVNLQKGYLYARYTYLSALPSIYGLSNATVRNTITDTNSAVIPTTLVAGKYNYNFDNFFTSDPDGIGVGLEDIDNDGFYDDLPPGNTVTLDIDITIDCTDYTCTSPDIIVRNLGGRVGYHDMCDRKNLVYLDALPGTGDVNTIVRSQISANGYIPTNIQGGGVVGGITTDAVPFNVRGSIGYYQYFSSLRTDNSRFQYVFTLPVGSTASNVQWANGKYPAGTLSVHSNWEQVGNILTVTGDTSSLGWTTFDVVYDCTAGGNVSNYTIDYKVYDVNNYDSATNTVTCSCLSEIACGTLSALAHCPSPCTDGGPTTGLATVERADNSLGWTDHTLATRQLRENISAYDLSKALYLDTIEITGNGVQTAARNDLFAELILDKTAGGVDKLTPKEIYVEIERANTVVSSATITSFVATNSTTTEQVITWNLTSGIPSDGLKPNDIIRTKSSYQVAINDGLPTQDIQSGKTWHLFNTDGANTRYGCNVVVPEMFLVGLISQDGHNQARASACNTTTLGGSFHHLALRFNSSGLNYTSEYRPGAYVEKYELTVPPAYSLLSNSYIHNTGGGTVDMVPDTHIGNTYTYNNPGAASANFWAPYRTTVVNGYGALIRPIFQPNCGASTNTEPVIGKVYVKDFYYHYADQDVKPNTWDKVFTHAPVPVYTGVPVATISDQTGLIQASAPVESWQVRLNNSSLNTTPYTWIAIPDVANVTIVQVIDEATNLAITPIDYTGGKIYHLDAAGLVSGASNNYKIEFSYNTCVKTNVEVLSGWDCTSFVTDPNNTTCGTKSQVTLSFIPKEGEVTIIPVTEPSGTVSLCNSVSFEYNVNSAQAGNVVDTKFSIHSVPGLTPTAGSFQARYPADSRGTWQNISATQTANEFIYDLTTHPDFPVDGIPGVKPGNAAERLFGVRFTVDTDCDFISGSNFEISTNATKPCGNAAIGNRTRVQTAPINITGVELTYNIVNALSLDTSSSGNFNTCGSAVKLKGEHIVVEIVGGTTTGINGYAEIRLPAGYEYVSGSYICTSVPSANCATFDSVSTALDGTQIIKLLIPAGLSNTDIFTYTLEVIETLTSPAFCGEDIIELVTIDEVTDVPCSTAPGGKCSVLKYQTGKTNFDITIEKATLSLIPDNVTAVVNANDEDITLDFTVSNNASIATNSNTIVQIYYDSNLNGTYDADDLLLESKTISDVIPGGGSVSDVTTFKATTSQACNLLLVARIEDNPCTCGTVSVLIPSSATLDGAAGEDKTVCSSNDTVQIGIANNPGYTYSWKGVTATETSYLTILGTGLSSAQPTFSYVGATITAPVTLIYTVTVVEVDGGCISTDTVSVTVNPSPSIPIIGSSSLEVCPDEFFSITFSNTLDSDEIILLFKDEALTDLAIGSISGSADYWISEDEAGTYPATGNLYAIVQSTTSGECGSDVVVIPYVVKDCTVVIEVPDGFTPNGDGINDLFEINDLEVEYPDFSMEIVNRYGNIVYKYKHNGNAGQNPAWWDGYSDGRWNFTSKILPSGTYFYTIYFNNGQDKPQTGWVYLRK